jgi:hypothetical protein
VETPPLNRNRIGKFTFGAPASILQPFAFHMGDSPIKTSSYEDGTYLPHYAIEVTLVICDPPPHNPTPSKSNHVPALKSLLFDVATLLDTLMSAGLGPQQMFQCWRISTSLTVAFHTYTAEYLINVTYRHHTLLPPTILRPHRHCQMRLSFTAPR